MTPNHNVRSISCRHRRDATGLRGEAAILQAAAVCPSCNSTAYSLVHVPGEGWQHVPCRRLKCPAAGVAFFMYLCKGDGREVDQCSLNMFFTAVLQILKNTN